MVFPRAAQTLGGLIEQTQGGSSSRLTESACKFYAGCITLALEAAAAAHIIHRDVKPENILLGSSGYLQLTDWGCSVQLEHADETKIAVGDKVYSYCTTTYRAPELWKSEKTVRLEYNRSVDIWSMGVIVFELLMGSVPFIETRVAGKVDGGKHAVDIFSRHGHLAQLTSSLKNMNYIDRNAGATLMSAHACNDRTSTMRTS